MIIDRALEDPEVSKLHVVNKQKTDRRSWLAKNIRVRPDGKSEIIAVSIETDTPDASAKIVNAVVDSYLKFVEDSARDTDSKMVSDLQVERRTQFQTAQQLQERIRSTTRHVAGMGAMATVEGGLGGGFAQGESLQRDVYMAQAQLVSMQAKLKAIKERLAKPQSVTIEGLIKTNPRYAALSAEIEELQEQKNDYAQASPNHPMIRTLDQRIEQAKDRLKQLASNNDDGGLQGMLQGAYLTDKMTEWTLEQDIRAQQILVDELMKKHDDQLANNAERSGGAAEVAFDRVQLARIDKNLDAIDDRILTIKTERRAPSQIIHLSPAVSSEPSRAKQLMRVGMGAVVFSCVPLILSIALERMKPRLYHVSQVRRAIPQVLIGEIMEPPVSWVQGATFRRRLARYRESVHNWCTHLLLSDPFRSCKTLSVASVAGDDGKTFLAVQIAVAMAQMKSMDAGPVLIIDGDMRVGRLHLLFGNEETGDGLADVLSHRVLFGETVVQDERESQLHLLTAGQLTTTPYELLGDGRFRELLDMLEQRYSLILVVLPPVANASESLIMAACTDSTLLCVRQGETVLAAMEDVYRKLVNTGSSVDGIVVKDIPYYQMASRDGGFADKLEQIRLSHLLQYAE
jgi:capsular exopolysaccharide synthesis family protein